VGVASAATVVGPESYLSAVAGAGPGAVIKLKPGIYKDGLPLRDLNGTADKPIVIEAADTARPPQFFGRPDHNTVSIVNSSYVTIRNLILDGRDLPVDAVKAEGTSRYAHHVTIDGLRIIGHGVDQTIVGISAQCPGWGWTIRRNVIIGAGTGMYLGGPSGVVPFFAGVIEHNLVANPRGYAIQIKQQVSRPTDFDAPVAPQTTIIRHNVFSKLENASEGELARPNLLVGHFPNAGPGTDDRYLIYGNFFYANSTEALFQGEGNVALYANVFLNPLGDAIRFQPHKDVPKNIWIFHNTIVARGVGIRLLGSPADYVRLLEDNVVFAEESESSREYSLNLTGTYADAAKYLVDPRAAPGQLRLDLTPSRG